MSDKVILPKEVAEAIEKIKESSTHNPLTKYGVLIAYTKKFPNLGEYDTIMQALVYGFEVEQTPEDKVREYYKTLERDTRTVKYHRDSEADIQHHALTRAEMNGIEGTLERLNIKISGVNAE